MKARQYEARKTGLKTDLSVSLFDNEEKTKLILYDNLMSVCKNKLTTQIDLLKKNINSIKNNKSWNEMINLLE